MKMTDKELLERLEKLEASQIEIIRDAFKAKFPECRKSTMLVFDLALSDKQKDEQNAFLSALLEAEEKNAPDSAATPSQGNETHKPA